MTYSLPLNPDWVAAFADLFEKCAIRKDEDIVLLSERASRPVSIEIAKPAVGQLALRFLHIEVPTPPEPAGPIVKTSGASVA